MKPLILTLLACATSALAQMPLVHLPIDTNSLVGTSTPFWLSNPPPAYVAAYQVYQAVEENNKRIENAFGGLSDTQTNALVNSPKVTTYMTNSLRIPHGGYVALWDVTNFAGMNYTTLEGSPALKCSYDGGANWTALNPAAITNTTFKLGFTTETNGDAMGAAPLDAVVTNVVVYTLERPDKFGTINAVYGQSLRVGPPLVRDDAVNRGYVDDLYKTTAWWSAQNDVQLQGHALNWSQVWQTGTTSDTNETLYFRLLGQDQFLCSAPKPLGVSGVSIAKDGTGTNLVVSVPTNGLSAPPRLEVTRYLSPATWSMMTNSPTTSGTNYVFTFPLPWIDSGFFAAVKPSNMPSMFTVAGVFRLSQRTITNSTDSTFGYGAGLVSVDGSYLYVSTGTNQWKRVALSGW